MWMLLPLLLVPPVVLLLFRKLNPHTFTVKEFLVLEGGMSVLLVVGFLLARWGALQDHEFWNGRITAKPNGSEGCCHCRQECDTCTSTDANGNSSTHSCNCRTICDHAMDFWWALDFSTGDRVSLKSCEPNPLDVPDAWTRAFIGEAGAIPHMYTNYLLADPDSVLLQKGTGPQAQVPGYPQGFDFYRVNRALNLGTTMSEADWNKGLMELNADLGASKEVNIVVIATTNPSPAYADSVQEHWLYGKKNDLIFTLGAPDGNKVEWARVVTISRVEQLKVEARDTLIGSSLMDTAGTLAKIQALVTTHFTRTPMEEFEYLGAAAKPATWALVLLYIAGIIGSILGSIYMVQNDPFGEERLRHRFPRMPNLHFRR